MSDTTPFSIRNLRAFIKIESEVDYQKFSSRLLPTVSNIAGVRIPKLHRYVNTLLSHDFDHTNLSLFEDITFEETMIQGLLIAKGPWRQDLRKKLIQDYAAKIGNWSHCDTFCKFIKDVDPSYLSLIQENALSTSEYQQRFAMVMLLEHFIDESYIDTILTLISAMTPQGYYSKMAIAWLLSLMYQPFPNEVIAYIKTSALDYETKRKTIQKIKESLKTTPEQKKAMIKLARNIG